ncbi:hypothetical protein ABIE45_006224 [Methylobacterium sp. OAE515]|uniref:recombinase family protein n=1 Tax=Methylobacterium sp. OAE515 TaxID=2817895 RepID=UPI001789734D
MTEARKTNLEVASALGLAARNAKAEAFVSSILPVIARIRASGLATNADIAAELNARQVRTPRGGQWSAIKVQQVLARAV